MAGVFCSLHRLTGRISSLKSSSGGFCSADLLNLRAAFSKSSELVAAPLDHLSQAMPLRLFLLLCVALGFKGPDAKKTARSSDDETRLARRVAAAVVHALQQQQQQQVPPLHLQQQLPPVPPVWPLPAPNVPMAMPLMNWQFGQPLQPMFFQGPLQDAWLHVRSNN